MWRDPSQATVGGLSSISAGVSELGCPSAFDRELPQSTEAFSVKLARGLKTHASPRVAGELPSGRGLRVPTRTYNVTVEPRGHSKKPKDAMREAARYRTDIDLDVERRKAGDEEVDELVEERFLFRRERLKRFQVGSHFPALVSPRLVPAWKLSQAGKLSMEEQQASSGSRSARGASPRSQRLGPPASLTKPTASHARKQQYKRPSSMESPWFVSGASGASDLICDRRPVLHTEEYDDGNAMKDMREDDERLWVTESHMGPPNVAAAKVSFDSNKPQLDAHIAAMRERGRAYNESLKERYEILRENFQREQAAVIERQGCLSTFEMSQKEKAQQAQVRGRSHDTKEAEKKDAPADGIKGFASGLLGRGSRSSTKDRVSLRPGLRSRPSFYSRTAQAAKILHAEFNKNS